MLLAVLLLAQPAGPWPFCRYPDINGDKVVFTNQGDLWLGDWRTGACHRLTSDPGEEIFAHFSPDGKEIAFEGEYEGAREAYVMPAEGGIPLRITGSDGLRAVTGWTPDGKEVVYRTTGYPTNYAYYTVPAAGGVPKKLPLEFASHVSYDPAGTGFAFTRFDRWYMAWFRYAGGMQNQIWTYRGGKFIQVTDMQGTCEFPVWTGDRIYFAHEDNAKFSLMSVPASGGAPRVELPDGPYEIRNLSTDGKRIVFEIGSRAEIFEPSTRQTVELKPQLSSDFIHEVAKNVSATGNVGDASVTATGKRVLVESRGQIVSLPVEEGEAKVWLQRSGVRLRTPVMSPNAKKVAFFSDEGGEENVWVADADGSGAKQLTRRSSGHLVQMQWSPDSKSVAFYDSSMTYRLLDVSSGSETILGTTATSWSVPPVSFSPDSRLIAILDTLPGTDFTVVKVFDTKAGKAYQVSDGLSNDPTAAFTADGKSLVVLSTRAYSPTDDPVLNQLSNGPATIAAFVPLTADAKNPLALKDDQEGPAAEPAKTDAPKSDANKPEPEKRKDAPVDYDFEHAFARRWEIPIPPGNYTQVDAVEGKVLLADGHDIKVFDVAAKSLKSLTDGPGFQLSSDRKHLLVQAGPNIRVIDLDGDKTHQVGFGGLRLTVAPRAEWTQEFWDAWRLLRDYFYVANMHGNDWKEVGRKYSAMLPSIHSRDELDELIRWMQAELGSSHEYISPGDMDDLKPRLGIPSLGIDLVEAPGGYYRISHIVRGDSFRTDDRSPLLNSGQPVKEGMYLIEVAGAEAKVGTDPYRNLWGRAGQTVTVKVNSSPSQVGATALLVRPAGSDARMRDLDWAAQNKAYVDKASHGRIGYIHMDAMEPTDFRDFIVQYFSQRDKEALVIDDRFNNGGYVQEYINRILGVRLAGYFNQRDSKYSWTRQRDFFNGPMCCLINEFCISCGEEFPHRFRDLKLGPLVGRRTKGGEVGSDPGWPLVDGGRVNVPNYGFWSPKKGWEIEGRGVSPDIDVPSSPAAFLAGHDTQLDAAVGYLMKQLPATPPARPSQPASRDRTKPGG